MDKPIYIIKATGEREIFDPEKLRASLLRANTKAEVADQIIFQIEKGLKENTTTREIYDHAFKLLKKSNEPKVTAKYSLRNAIMDLGPSGFPFEQFVAEIFRAKGFETITDFIAGGECANHEIDIVAWNSQKLIFVEAKFHNEFGIKSDFHLVILLRLNENVTVGL
jgi:hypothetical protein